MITIFTVENFRAYHIPTELHLDEPANFLFNSSAVAGFNADTFGNDHTGIVREGVIYGRGKTSFGHALMDIVNHLVDDYDRTAADWPTELDKRYHGAKWDAGAYGNYLNGVVNPAQRTENGERLHASFRYVFEFDGSEVVYSYKKGHYAGNGKEPFGQVLLEELLTVNGAMVYSYDYPHRKGYATFAQSLDLNDLEIPDDMCRLKYIWNKVLSGELALGEGHTVQMFRRFMAFIYGMVMISPLAADQGWPSYAAGIVQLGGVRGFRELLQNHGYSRDITTSTIPGHDALVYRFPDGAADFDLYASRGEKALAQLYYWYLRMPSVMFCCDRSIA